MDHFAAAPGQHGVQQRISRQMSTPAMTLGGAPGRLLDSDVEFGPLEPNAIRRLRR